ncbi:hypothetical protein LOD99_5901 [Oopsacas minuta]|uniref:Uncharacterized protein n=1 Tax=Oopsacas minuta TaxID=111878 RepID=A0AAV7JPK8_9METZ|nr:hypothetical protein LOD99_5901 [Oopsacas minuta]
MQMKHDSSLHAEHIYPTTTSIHCNPVLPRYRQTKSGGDLLKFLKSATLESVKVETSGKAAKRRKRVVHPSQLILRNMNEEGIDCSAYLKRRVGRKPRPNVIPDEQMKSEDYFDPLVEALFTDASEVERLPQEAFKTPDGRSFPQQTRLRGRPPKRKIPTEIPIERLVSVHANFSYNYNFNNNNNNNNSNNNNNNYYYTHTTNNSQQCFSDPALANILQDELQFLPTTIEELYTNTVQTNLMTPSNMSMSNLTLHSPKSPKKLRPISVRPTHKSCRRKLDLSQESAFHPENYTLPPPKRVFIDSHIPPLPVNYYPYPPTDLIPSPISLSNRSWTDSTGTRSYGASPTVEAPYDLELDQILDSLGREQSQTTYFSNNGILVE